MEKQHASRSSAPARSVVARRASSDDLSSQNATRLLGSPGLTRADVVRLQRSVGNAQTGRFLAQRITEADLKARGQRIRALAANAPEKGVNLWLASHASGASVHLLGTQHGSKMGDVGSDATMRKYLIDFLTGGGFTDVYTEMPEQLPYVKYDPGLAAQLEKYVTLKNTFDALPASTSASARKIAERRVIDANSGTLTDVLNLGMDAAYLLAATSTGTPKRGALESEQTRQLAHDTNVADMNIPADDPQKKLSDATRANAGPDANFRSGNQKALFTEVADELEAGKDIASAEERNRQWMEIMKQNLQHAPQMKQLWIVGAAHLPGLVLRFGDLGWNVTHQAPPPMENQTTPSNGAPNTANDID